MLAHVMIFAKHLAPMATFYEKVFDLVPRPSSDPKFLVLESAKGAGIALHALPEDIARGIDITQPPRRRDDVAYKVCFAVPDLEAYRQRILAHGGRADEPWEWERTRFAECTDPEGNALQLFVTA